MKGGSKGRRGTAGPQTAVGVWLRATSLSQTDLSVPLSKLIPTGPTGFRDDEVAVVYAACELATRRYFGPEYDVREVTGFAIWLREVWIGSYLLDVMQFEAVMRAAMGETDVDLAGITQPALTKAYCVITSYICKQLELADAEVSALVAAAEATAIERGWQPQPARDQA